jgi:hypothetical protein
MCQNDHVFTIPDHRAKHIRETYPEMWPSLPADLNHRGCSARLKLQLDLADAITERTAAQDELNERLQLADESITNITRQVLDHTRDCHECVALRETLKDAS